jgi:hypothetical protein
LWVEGVELNNFVLVAPEDLDYFDLGQTDDLNEFVCPCNCQKYVFFFGVGFAVGVKGKWFYATRWL